MNNSSPTFQRSIYLDYHATTPTDPRVIESMLPYFYEKFGNSMSQSHTWGWTAEQAISKARKQVADLVKCSTQEIYFTSGATESNNWAVRGLIDQIRSENKDERIHLLCGAAEHSSILNTFKAAEKLWLVDIDIVPVNRFGQIEPEVLEKLIKPSTKLISVTWVQNEIGSINPIRKIGEIARKHQVYFHTDATQAIGKMDVNLQNIPVDMLSCSAHKIYGPKGIGFLFLRNSNPKVRILPLLYGGGHERGERSGTLNTPGIVGLGKSCEILSQEMTTEILRVEKLRNILRDELLKLPDVVLNGHPSERSPMNLHLTFKGRKIENHVAKLSKIGFSAGAACMSGSWKATPVLKSIGLTDEEAQGSIRLSIGRWTTEEDVREAIEILSSTLRLT